jgi:signal transduction histidine kinase
LTQKNNWIFFISCLMAVLVVTFITVYRSLHRKVNLRKQQLLNTEQQQEISNLKAVMAGEEKERTRIARELHDGIMVQLAVIKMKLRKARVTQQVHEEQSLDAILQQLDDTSRELRRTAHNLMPDMLLETGLTDAVFYYCNNLQKETGLNIVFQHYGTLPALSPEAELYLYRIVQELLQNIIKHAHASKALVQLNYHVPLLSLSIEDNGVGFDRDIIDSGMGLKSIYSRLRVLKGTIDLQSKKQLGTAIFIELNIESLTPSKKYNYADPGSDSR